MGERVEKPGHASLRRFRFSQSDAVYFLTANLEGGESGLEKALITDRIAHEWRRLEIEQGWTVLTGVVMPDHIHLLIQLGWSLSLPECMRLFRGRLSPILRLHGLHWQKAFYDHRLRGSEDLLPVFLYIHLNPYRANLLPRTAVWPGYYCRVEDRN